MFDRYTKSAKRVLFLARGEAQARCSASIRTEHLLLGVIRVADQIANTILTRAGVSIEVIELEMPAPESSIPPSVEIPFHSETKRVLQYAATESERSQGVLLANYVLADDHIGPEHLLLGLLREDTTVAAAVLARHGVTIDLARAEVVRQSR